MQTQRILRLLVEASTTIDPVQMSVIQDSLAQETANYDRYEEMFEPDVPSYGAVMILNALFVKLWTETPHLLPQMLPFFDMVCGDRDGNHLLRVFPKE
jgi:hypothetical protein